MWLVSTEDVTFKSRPADKCGGLNLSKWVTWSNPSLLLSRLAFHCLLYSTQPTSLSAAIPNFCLSSSGTVSQRSLWLINQIQVRIKSLLYVCISLYKLFVVLMNPQLAASKLPFNRTKPSAGPGSCILPLPSGNQQHAKSICMFWTCYYFQHLK